MRKTSPSATTAGVKPADTLHEIVEGLGHAAFADAKRLANLLLDADAPIGDPLVRRQRNLIVAAAQHGLPSQLLRDSGNVPDQAARARASRRLADDLGVNNDLADWAADAWAEALRGVDPRGAEMSLVCPTCNALIRLFGQDLGGPTNCPACAAELWLYGWANDVELDSLSRPPSARLDENAGGPAAGDELLTVCNRGTGDHATISAALATARPGAIIVVREGVYAERLVISKSIRIQAQGDLGTVELSPKDWPAVEVRGASARLDRLKVGNVVPQRLSGDPLVRVRDAQLAAVDCDFTVKSADVIDLSGEQAELRFFRSTIQGGRTAMYLSDGAVATLVECSLREGEVGIRLLKAKAVLRDTSIIQSSREGIKAERATLDMTGGCVEDSGGYGLTFRGCEINLHNVRVAGSRGRGLWAYGGTRGSVKGCTFQNNVRGDLHADADCDVAR